MIKQSIKKHKWIWLLSVVALCLAVALTFSITENVALKEEIPYIKERLSQGIGMGLRGFRHLSGRVPERSGSFAGITQGSMSALQQELKTYAACLQTENPGSAIDTSWQYATAIRLLDLYGQLQFDFYKTGDATEYQKTYKILEPYCELLFRWEDAEEICAAELEDRIKRLYELEREAPPNLSLDRNMWDVSK